MENLKWIVLAILSFVFSAMYIGIFFGVVDNFWSIATAPLQFTCLVTMFNTDWYKSLRKKVEKN